MTRLKCLRLKCLRRRLAIAIAVVRMPKRTCGAVEIALLLPERSVLLSLMALCGVCARGLAPDIMALNKTKSIWRAQSKTTSA